MTRKRKNRSPEEELEYKRRRLEQRRINQIQRRANTNLNLSTELSQNNVNEFELDIRLDTNYLQNIVQLDHNYCKKNNIQRNIESTENKEHYIGLMNVICDHCKAKHFASERVSNKGNSFRDCCSHGNVQLSNLPNPPEELKSLFDRSHPKSNNFHLKIRSFNNNFAFASFNANLVQFQGRAAPYCFKIQGQIYYQINTALYPNECDRPSYGQLFVIDQNEALQHRLNSNNDLDSEILTILDTIMRNNIFAKSYEMMGKELEEQKKRNNNETIPELQLMFSLKPGMDHRRYNFQKTNEIAAIFDTTADGDIPDSYVVIRNKQTKKLQKVSTMDSNVEPWVFPLFYPFGTQGWHSELKHVTNVNKRITRSEYFKFRLAIRNEYNVFIHGGRLFQQWIVDSYVKVEKDRINYCRDNQTKLRAETYRGITDYLETTANSVNGRLGKMIILPSSFPGSPRNMMQSYQDSMAIAREFGKPDLFITLTCNPRWREIQENLLSGQQASDRPDICARVFDIKKNDLIDSIVKRKLFGEVLAYVYVIEFQKRGLPHIHLLVTLKENYKLKHADLVDKFISAEIPDYNDVLHDIVMKHMIHGPCGNYCLVNNKCSKRFPKAFQEETTFDKNNYPTYRRRNTGIVYNRPNGFTVDNRYVVPYSPILLLRYNCHINVEVVSNIRSVKYLYKYFYKGHDSASVIIGSSVAEECVINYDEIKDFDSRYVGPMEAYMRIVSKKMKDKSHSVTRLPVHLPNEQSIIIDNNTENISEESLESALNQATMLIDYFALNARDEDAKQISYVNIPRYYVFKKSKVDNKSISRWEKRQKRFNCIGRMYSVSPSQTELFHLRLLLLHRKGAVSFNDLQTVNGIFYPTFTSTCLAMGLIEDDDEWNRTMAEAVFWMMPSSLRKLFVRILIHCQPMYPEKLWDEFKLSMSEDYINQIGIIKGQQKAYVTINNLLRAEGKCIADFPSMNQQITEESYVEENVEFKKFCLEIGTNQYKQLNKKQKEIIDIIIENIENCNSNSNNKNCFYVDGPGGSGKIFLYTTLWYLLKSKGKNICTMAFTGIAAILLPQGKTVHKTFGLPVPLYSDSSSNIKPQSVEAKNLIQIDVFIWDEAPMAPRYALDIMNSTLQDLLNNDLPFGGKTVLLGGDFRQLLPIQVGSTRSETVNLSIKFSKSWMHFQKFTLIENMRALPEEQEFSKWLINMGNGYLNDNDDNIIIPEQCLIHPDSDLVKIIFQDLLTQRKFKEASKCVILSARNVDVNEINKKVIDMLDEKTEKIYTSIDSTENCNDNDSISEALLPEYLNTLMPPSLPPYELRLRINTVIMLIRNLNIHEGLCNGTRLLILDMQNHSLKCEILTGDKTGDIIFLNRITLYCDKDYPFTFKRRQFPIKPAFAMTINKSQGQTFEKIGIDLEKDVFSHGQLYVAFSRVRSWKSVYVSLGKKKCSSTSTTKNIVYKELYL